MQLSSVAKMKFISCIFSVLFLSFLGIRPVYALRCASQIVSEGNTTTQVLEKCGEPRLKNTEQKEILEPIGNDFRKTFVPLEYWVYDFGPSRLIQILEFQKDRLVKIESADYGPYQPKPEICQKTPSLLPLGNNKSQLLIQCGAPSSKIYQEELLKQNDGSYLKSSLELWTYQVEPNRPPKTFRFRDGVMDQITSP